MSAYVVSPKSGKPIKVGGPTYEKLKASTKWAPLLRKSKSTPKGKNTKKGTSTPGPQARGSGSGTFRGNRSKVSKAKGSSAFYSGKYMNKGISKDEFCGLAGGAKDYTYPVNTPGRARAALSYARHAPNPEGIKTCARRVAKKKGWLDAEGKIRQK
jgi:hypothetical protein